MKDQYIYCIRAVQESLQKLIQASL